jgi:hypothetical protein
MAKTKEKPKQKKAKSVKVKPPETQIVECQAEKQSLLTTQFELSAVGAKGKPGTTHEQYGQGILAVEGTRDSLKWAQADLMNELEDRFPEEASQYWPKFLDLSTVKRWRWLAARIPMKDRRQELTFSHHEAVASIIEEPVRKEYLQKAIDERWSVREMAKAISEAGVKREEKRPKTSIEARINNQPVPMEVVEKEAAEAGGYNPEPPTEVKETKEIVQMPLGSTVEIKPILSIDDLSEEDQKSLGSITGALVVLMQTDPKDFDEERKKAWYKVLEKLESQVHEFVKSMNLY